MRTTLAASVTLFFALFALGSSVVATPAMAQSASDIAHAQELFQQGEQAYAEGRFTDAAGLMAEAYSLAPEPILLYNLARALEATGDWQGSVDAYTRYLESPGELTHRARAEAHRRSSQRQLEIEQLRASQDSHRGDDRDDDRDMPPPPAPTGPGVQVDPVPWIVAGGGVLVVGLGAVFGSLALDKQSAAQNAATHESGYAALSDAQTYAMVANVCFIAGGLIAATGVTWGVISLVTSSSPSAPSATARLGLGSLEIQGQF